LAGGVAARGRVAAEEGKEREREGKEKELGPQMLLLFRVGKETKGDVRNERRKPGRRDGGR
jgi:hypothetical protein